MGLLVHVILSLAFAFSLAIMLVEKGDDWPITILTKPLRGLLGFFNSKLPHMLECTVCASFWASLVGELVLKCFITGIFLWPFTGVIALGLTWFVIEFLNVLDKTPSPSEPPNDKTH